MDENGIERLIEASKAGDAASFGEVFQIYSKSLYLTALVILRNPTDAEDAVQDTALIALSKIKDLRDNHYFKTWITRVLINRCKRIIRIINRCKTSELISRTSWIEPLNVDEIALWQALDKMSKEEKTLLSLRYINDLDIKEISSVLNSPIGTVKSKIHRSIKKLTKLLEVEES
jgi:RNA polymerase sigma-70 factor (ECF subfamily)